MPRPRIEVPDEDLPRIEAMAGYGLTMPMIAKVLGYATRTLRLRKSEEARVAAAFEAGKAKAEALVGQALYQQATSGNISAIKYWENTRAGRRIVTQQEISGRDGGAIEYDGALILSSDGAVVRGGPLPRPALPAGDPLEHDPLDDDPLDDDEQLDALDP